MKTNIVLIFLVVFGIILLIGGVALWHLSSTSEFSRTDAPASEAQ